MVSKVYLVGAGLGNPDTLTQAAVSALRSSGLIIGSERLIDALGDYGAKRLCLVRTADIVSALALSTVDCASVVLSGDLGIYSGAAALREALKAHPATEVVSLPGISAVAYLASKLNIAYQNARIVSRHGRDLDVVAVVRAHRQVFVYTGGASSPQSVARELAEGGLGDVRVSVGERLSYPDERIACDRARVIAAGHFSDLSLLYVENEQARGQQTPLHLKDEAFLRAQVPMTKDEVRALIIAKLELGPTSCVWDIGAGTGSVAIEAARVSFAGRSFAVECRQEATELIALNKERLGAHNLEVVSGRAPEALVGLPTPDAVFIGGSSGQLKEIVAATFAANPEARVVVSAICLETLTATLEAAASIGKTATEVVQIQVNKGHAVAGLTMMRAQNPIYLISLKGEV